ncbi:hypothetical protein [Chryseobacterium taiwanense]|uniref:Uncharacterized protein n=1 Tax=Chryseobacterium taiwanense TaxID=363331 RepID=A0A0B4CZ31_9FLAO|nr:hypothetical protein [Chryseobacterium taiwanense]KIC61632.1 hypothetical protein RM51_14590 [Chryseobacterium taiwanense]
MDEQTANELRELLNSVSDDTSLQESKDIIDTLHTGNNPIWIQVNGGFAKTKIDEHKVKIQNLIDKLNQIL